MNRQKSNRTVTRQRQKSRCASRDVANSTGSDQEFTDFVHSLRGQWIIAKALHLAIQHMDSLPPRMRATSDQHDMRLILTHGYPHFAQLFQLLDSQAKPGTLSG